MKRTHFFYLPWMLFIQTTSIFAQDIKIDIPPFKDKYSAYVQQLENGDTTVDFTDFRNSFLASKQFSKKSRNYDDLQKKVYAAVKNYDLKEVTRLTKAMLGIDYTSMFALNYLQQTYLALGDTINSKKYQAIEFGLMYSITKSGDGKTCETGWHVTQIEEEYFVLQMMGASFQSQSTARGGKNECDKMVIKTAAGLAESIQKGKEKWVEIQGWDWEVEAATSWTKGGGAAVGKPNPGKLNFQHFFDTASTVILGYICSGKAFPKVELQMMKTGGKGSPETYFTMTMEGGFITRVSNSGSEDGRIIQRVELVFKTVKMDYKAQSNKDGSLGPVKTFSWDIPAGVASPSA